MQELLFSGNSCKLLMFRNVTDLRENLELKSQNQMISTMSHFMTNEMITPLKCIVQLLSKTKMKKPMPNLQLAQDACEMLVSQCTVSVDQNLLSINNLKPKFGHWMLNKEVL